MEKISRERLRKLYPILENQTPAEIIDALEAIGVEVEDEPESEIIEGLSPGKWHHNFHDATKLFDVLNEQGQCVGRIFEEADARLLAGSKTFLEAFVTFEVPFSMMDSSWEEKLEWLNDKRGGNAGGWASMFKAMKNMGVEFPGDEV